MKVSSDGHLEGARSLSRFSMQICIIWHHFLADMGPINWVGNLKNPTKKLLNFFLCFQ